MAQTRNLSILADSVNSSGVLGVAGGGTGVTTSTGTGSVVLSNNPTLTAPSVTGATGNISSASSQATGGTTLRTLASHASDYLNAKDFGAKGDGVANDLAAITAANIAGVTVLPSGVFYTGTGTIFTPEGRYYGPTGGKISTVEGGLPTKQSTSFSLIASPLTQSTNKDYIFQAFDGDVSKLALSFQTVVIGAATLGQPTSGYVFNPQASGIYGYTFNSSGYNYNSAGNNGRTGLTQVYLAGNNSGAGDLISYFSTVYATGTNDGATSFLSNSAISTLAGQVTAGASGVYLQGIGDINLSDAGYDAAAIGQVFNFNRTNGTGAIEATWMGFRPQSIGTIAIDSFYSMAGPSRIGIDFTAAVLKNLSGTATKSAIVLKAGQAIYGNGTNPGGAASGSLFSSTTVAGTEYFDYEVATGWQFVVGGSSVAQIKSTGVIVNGNINGSSGSFGYLSTSSSTSTTPTLSFNGSNTSVAKGATVAGSYVQDIIQNKSATAGASANYVVSPDNGTDSTFYGEFGINSSVFSASTPADFFSLNNQIYFSGHDGDVAVGSGNGYKTYFPWGATAASAHVINASGAWGFSTNLGTTLANSGTIGFGTSGQALITAGSGAAPAWGTLGASGGGTGVNNGSNTLTLGGAVTFLGAFTQAFTATAATSVTMPTSGTLLSTTATSLYSAAPLFGTGADGAVTISSGTMSLNRDMHYTNLTLSGTGALNTNGSRVFVSGTLDISVSGAEAFISSGNNGNNGSGATGAISTGIKGYNSTTPVNSSTVAAGGNGSTAIGAAGAVGSSVVIGVGGAGGIGGAGGTSTFAGGAAPAAGFVYNTMQFPTPTQSLNAASNLGVFINGGLNAGSGAGGGGDGTNSGGGGGGAGNGAATMQIYARYIQKGTNATAGIFVAKGGAGGNGSAGVAGNAAGGGGGGGGGGGLIYIVTEQLLGSTITNAINVSGGTGGSGGNGLGTGKGGNGGAGGNGGNIQVLVLNPASFTASAFNTAGTAGSTTTTSTGAAGGAGATVQGNI